MVEEHDADNKDDGEAVPYLDKGAKQKCSFVTLNFPILRTKLQK